MGIMDYTPLGLIGNAVGNDEPTSYEPELSPQASPTADPPAPDGAIPTGSAEDQQYDWSDYDAPYGDGTGCNVCGSPDASPGGRCPTCGLGYG